MSKRRRRIVVDWAAAERQKECRSLPIKLRPVAQRGLLSSACLSQSLSDDIECDTGQEHLRHFPQTVPGLREDFLQGLCELIKRRYPG